MVLSRQSPAILECVCRCGLPPSGGFYGNGHGDRTFNQQSTLNKTDCYAPFIRHLSNIHSLHSSCQRTTSLPSVPRSIGNQTYRPVWFRSTYDGHPGLVPESELHINRSATYIHGAAVAVYIALLAVFDSIAARAVLAWLRAAAGMGSTYVD